MNLLIIRDNNNMPIKDICNSKDTTLERNTIKQWKYLINEYLLIKDKKHPRFKFVNEFYKVNNIKRQNFIKYYNRYKLSILSLLNNTNNKSSINTNTILNININDYSLDEIDKINKSLLPQKRGVKYLQGRSIFNIDIINKIKELRINYGMNRYVIRNELEIYFNSICNNP